MNASQRWLLAFTQRFGGTRREHEDSMDERDVESDVWVLARIGGVQALLRRADLPKVWSQQEAVDRS